MKRLRKQSKHVVLWCFICAVFVFWLLFVDFTAYVHDVKILMTPYNQSDHANLTVPYLVIHHITAAPSNNPHISGPIATPPQSVAINGINGQRSHNCNILSNLDVEFGVNCSWWKFKNASILPYTHQALYDLFWQMDEQDTEVVFLGDSVTRRFLYSLNHLFDGSRQDKGPTWHSAFKFTSNVARLKVGGDNDSTTYYVLANDEEVSQSLADIPKVSKSLMIRSWWTAVTANVTEYFREQLQNVDLERHQNLIYVIGIGSHHALHIHATFGFSGFESVDLHPEFAALWGYIETQFNQSIETMMKTVRNVTSFYEGRIKVIFRTQTSSALLERMIIVWNRLLLQQFQVHQNQYMYLYDPYIWSVNPDSNVYDETVRELSKVFSFKLTGEIKSRYWNLIRNPCVPCDDLWYCVHFTSESREVLVHQTLNAVQIVFQSR